MNASDETTSAPFSSLEKKRVASHCVCADVLDRNHRAVIGNEAANCVAWVIGRREIASHRIARLFHVRLDAAENPGRCFRMRGRIRVENGMLHACFGGVVITVHTNLS
jgi:hypothetical protein